MSRILNVSSASIEVSQIAENMDDPEDFADLLNLIICKYKPDDEWYKEVKNHLRPETRRELTKLC